MSNRLLSILLVVCVAVILVLLVSSGPTTAKASESDYVVLCSSCTIPSDHNNPYLIVLNTTTRQAYAFREISSQPIPLGRMALP